MVTVQNLFIIGDRWDGRGFVKGPYPCSIRGRESLHNRTNFFEWIHWLVGDLDLHNKGTDLQSVGGSRITPFIGMNLLVSNRVYNYFQVGADQ